MSITAILVTYNSAGVVGGALESLRASGVTRCMVVDNASRDTTAEVAAAAWPEAEIIRNPGNAGFGCGNNMALPKVTTEFALLINPDARIDRSSLMALMDAAARYPEAAILAPMLVDETGRVHHSYKRMVFVREKDPGRYIAPSGDLCAEFLSGAVWLVRMDVLRKIGFYDPKIFLYYEDDDLCLRTRLAGFSCVLVAGAQAVHLMGRSSTPNVVGERFRHRHMAWSRLYMEMKYRGTRSAQILALRMVVVAKFKRLLYTGRPRRARYVGRVEGLARFVCGQLP